MFNNKTYTTFRESDLPPLIYKYRKWSDPLHKTILTRNEIYFPKPFDVEEKFELSLPTDYVSISEEDIIDYILLHNLNDGVLFGVNKAQVSV